MIKNLKTYNVSATQITIIVKIFVLLIIVNSQSIISKKNYTSIDLWKDISYKTNSADIYVHPNHKAHFVEFLGKLKIGYYVKIGDLGKVIDEEEKELSKRRIFKSGDHPSFMTINEYHNLDEIESYLDSLCNNFDTVETIIIGTSYEKRPIRGVIITEKNDKIKKKVLINGCIHSREWLSCATMIYIMNELTNNSKKYEQFLSTTEVHIIPVINVDGYVYTWDHDRLWRKTRSGPYNGCYGVDPNRNFDFKWRFSGYSTNPCDETYAGESPFSEPESKALGDYIKNALSNGHPFSVYFDIHTYSENFIYPYGYDHVYPSNVNDLRDISNKATQAIYSIHQSNFNFGSICDIVYPASGSTIDYATSIGGIKHAFAMELRPNEYVSSGFVLPSSQIIAGASEAWEGIYVVFNKSCVLYYNDIFVYFLLLVYGYNFVY
uniref:Peptidase_M14 domain-containing protein n=1 Tax=Strongyloides papillosus TaxID=174720 RepID=A0A0N5B8V4_STREA